MVSALFYPREQFRTTSLFGIKRHNSKMLASSSQPEQNKNTERTATRTLNPTLFSFAQIFKDQTNSKTHTYTHTHPISQFDGKREVPNSAVSQEKQPS